jgi:hypothetical protein
VKVETLAAKVDQLEREVQLLHDENAIQKLEMAYGYYLEHLMVQEISDCWADNGSLEWFGLGAFRGKENIITLWKMVKQHFHERDETRHMGPRFCPFISVAPDGKSAAGRWYVAGGMMGASMLCENTYVKEDGVWKIDVMSVGGFPLDPAMMAGLASTSALGPDAAGAPAGQGPGGPPPMSPEEEETFSQNYMSYYPFTERLPRTPRQEYGPYLRPFSFKHPVTGKDVNGTVEAWNAANPCPMPPGGEKWTPEQSAPAR